MNLRTNRSDLSSPYHSTSDFEFDKRQDDFDKMIERQPLAVRENDFEYQVGDRDGRQDRCNAPFDPSVSSFGSLRTSARLVSVSETTPAHRSPKGYSTTLSSLHLGRSTRMFGKRPQVNLPGPRLEHFHRVGQYQRCLQSNQ